MNSVGSLICGTETNPISAGVSYNLKMVVNGSLIRVFVNDALKIEASDASLSSGKAGIASYGDAGFSASWSLPT